MRNAVLARLDVDVGGAHLDRAGDELVGESDHRRTARHVFQPFDVERCVRCAGRALGSFAGVAPRRDRAARAPPRCR